MDGAMGLDNRIWGGHLYTSAMHHFFQNASRRVLMLGMADSAHPAHHRYPVW